MKFILLLLPIVLFVIPYSINAKDVEKRGRIVGNFTANQCMRSSDKSKLFISIHHYQTKGSFHIIDEAKTYIEINNKKFTCNHTDCFITESQSPCKSVVDEFIFHIDRDNIPSLKNAEKVKFHFEMSYNGKSYTLDRTLDIEDIHE